MKFSRILSHFSAGLPGCSLVVLLFVSCVSSVPTRREMEEQNRTADAKYQKQQREKWLQAKAMWVKQAQKMQIQSKRSAPLESWKALLLVKGYPAEVSPIPSKDDVLALLGPPAKRRSYKETQGQLTVYDVWHYPDYKAVNKGGGEARVINIIWQTVGGQYYVVNLEFSE